MIASLVERVLIWFVALDQMKKMRKEPNGPRRRGQHPKHQGCVWAKFTVEADLPDAMKVGVFASPRSYDAVIRFSNGKYDDDRKHDVHGMAIKLLDVKGDKVLDEERHALTQDFILADHPVFFARNLRHLLQFAKALKKGKQGEELYEDFPAFRGFLHEAPTSPLGDDLLERNALSTRAAGRSIHCPASRRKLDGGA